MSFFKRARIRYILHRHAIPHAYWLNCTENLPLLQGLTAVEKAHLRELASLFLVEKNIVAVQDLLVTDSMRVMIASQACLPVLALGFDCLSGWTDIIVYPDAFRVNRDIVDSAGVLHHQENILSGECWSSGPVILSWADIVQDQKTGHTGRNVIIHEIAHKLDGLNGHANGCPPLHYHMSVPQWTAELTAAYETLIQQVQEHNNSCINPYAATNPAEFFAVVSEYFFSSPALLEQHFPGVYRQLQLYYRQDPIRCCSLKERN
ncbi:M90 family metallopeptidase [Methylomonas sp. AM2-LC]|uniref:M90 family metallopeptidase n=1 Tax=Methylomonas sp. AM2-LC TaxID=3153301 RepID=UPI003265EDF4